MPGNRPAAPAVPRTVAAVLTRAANVIDANGWHRGDLLDIDAACHAEDLRQVPVCAAGAIRIAAGHDPDDYSARIPAMHAFADWLSAVGELPITDADPVDRIAIWNDRHARSALDVITALRLAALAAA